jgi:hypothetical protein
MASTSSSRALWMHLLLGLSVGCSGAAPKPDAGTRQELLFTFDQDAQGWDASFTDLAPEQAPSVGFIFERRSLPAELGGAGGALFLSGRNVSDDLFMFLARPVTGLLPNTSYALTFELDLASNAPPGCLGIGGAPGESVYLKAGAAVVEPERVTSSTGGFQLNVDKGNQANGGANAVVVGNVANDAADCGMDTYRRIRRDTLTNPLRITTDAQGRLWLLVGTDSGFEGTTGIYYDTIRVVLEPAQG